MTWANLIDTTTGGNGATGYRVEIEGFDYSFVTDQEMANASVYPKRVSGLKRSSIKIEESISLPQAVLKMSGITFSIVDYQEQATIAFYRKPSWKGALTTNINSTTTNLQVTSNNGTLSTGDYIWCDTETMKVVGITPYGATGFNIIVQRGQLGSYAQSHFITTDLGTALKPYAQNAPITIERRRLKLYAYGEGDDLQGNGTLIWRGLISETVKLSGGDVTTYTFVAEPITTLLSAEVGIDGDDLKLRGLNFGAWGWTFLVEELTTNNLQNGSPGNTLYLAANGFYESVYDLAADLNNKLRTYTAGWTVKPGCQYLSSGELVFTQQCSTTSKVIRFSVLSAPMKFTKPNNGTNLDVFNIKDPNKIFPIRWGQLIEDEATRSVTANGLYATRFENPKFPQQLTIYNYGAPIATVNQPVSATDYADSHKLYLAVPTLSTLFNDLKIYDSDNNLVAATAGTNNQLVTSYDQTRRVITVDLYNYKFDGSFHEIIIIDNDHKICFGTSFGIKQGPVVTVNGITTQGTNTTVGNVIDWLDWMIRNSMDQVNNGTTPLLTEDDFDIADMKVVFNSLSKTDYQNNRGFSFFKKVAKLEDILNEEFKALGVIPALTADGRITIKQLRLLSPFETPDYTINSGDILTDNGYPQVVKNEFGCFNSIELKTNYNPIKNDWDQTYVINNSSQINEYGKQKQITISPYSTVQRGNGVEIDPIRGEADIIGRSLAFYAADYHVITCDVPFKFLEVPLGSSIQIKNKQIPNFTPDFSYVTSRRGSGRYFGLLIGKTFDLDSGRGTLKIFVNTFEWSGLEKNVPALFAPDGVANPATNTGGNIYSVPVNTTYTNILYPDIPNVQSTWQVGWGIRFDQWKSGLVNSGYGKVVSISGAGNAVTFTVDFTGGVVPTGFTTAGTTWLFRPTDAGNTFTAFEQTKYAFVDSGQVGPNNQNYSNNLNRYLGV